MRKLSKRLQSIVRFESEILASKFLKALFALKKIKKLMKWS
jgi:hypothetical protein